MIVGCGDLTILLVGLGFHCFLLKCKEKLRHSLGRPSRSDFVQVEVIVIPHNLDTPEFGVKAAHYIVDEMKKQGKLPQNFGEN